MRSGLNAVDLDKGGSISNKEDSIFMGFLKTFIFGILAGISIAIGGTVFLSLDNKVLGAVFFTVGLFTVCTFGFDLFTGKVCYVFDRDGKYALGLIFMWLGNFAGAWLTAFAESLTRIGPALQEKAAAMCTVKSDDTFLSLYILATTRTLTSSVNIFRSFSA